MRQHQWLASIFGDTAAACARRRRNSLDVVSFLNVVADLRVLGFFAILVMPAITEMCGAHLHSSFCAFFWQDPVAAEPKSNGKIFLPPLPPPPPPSDEALIILRQLQKGPPADMAGITSALDVLGMLGGVQMTPDLSLIHI